MVLQSSTRVYLESGKAFHSYSDTHKIFQFENSIQAQEGHSIQIELLDAELPISFYPVNSNNNQIHMFQSPGTAWTDETKTIPPGQYTAVSLATWLTANLTDMSVQYTPETNKFAFTSPYNTYFGVNTTAHKLLGVRTGGSELMAANFISHKSINLSGITNIFIKLMNLSLGNMDSYGKQSGILSKIVVDQPYGHLLHYEDFHHTKNILDDNHIERVEMRLVDVDGLAIGGADGLNGLEWSATLLFNFLPSKEFGMTGAELIEQLNESMTKLSNQQ
jgi:hypothetical protein